MFDKCAFHDNSNSTPSMLKVHNHNKESLQDKLWASTERKANGYDNGNGLPKGDSTMVVLIYPFLLEKLDLCPPGKFPKMWLLQTENKEHFSTIKTFLCLLHFEFIIHALQSLRYSLISLTLFTEAQ